MAIVSAQSPSAGVCFIVVDSTAGDPLIDPTLADPLKWTMRQNSTLYQGKGISNPTFNGFEMSFNSIGVQIGPDVISYSNAPSDIETVAGRMLPAVSDFSLT